VIHISKGSRSGEGHRLDVFENWQWYCLYREPELMLLLEVLYVLEYSGELPSGDVVTAPHLLDVPIFSENNQPLKSQFSSFDNRVPDS
jgi:hypothetical protein